MLGDRIESRRIAIGISQAELARRSKTPQTTLNSIIRTNPRTTPHLVRIARELGTSAAFLTGETDDPSVDSPTEPSLDSRTRELIDHFAMISAADQRAIVQLVQSLAGAIATTSAPS